MTDPVSLEYALSIWPDTRSETLTREAAAQIAEGLADTALELPHSASGEWLEGWDAAVQTIAMALRFKDFHL